MLQGDGEGGGTDLGQVIGQGMQQIQQQIVIHGDGMRLQVVRIVHMGGQPGQINLRDIINDPSNQIDMEQKDDSNKPKDDGEKPKDDFEEKLKAEFGARFEADPDNPDKNETDDEDTETKTQPPIVTVKDDKEKLQELRDEHAGHKIDKNEDNKDTDNDETTTTKTTIIYKTIKQDKLDSNTSRSPPQSIFHRLRPSKQRYTILKDEL